MAWPHLEVADILAAHGDAYVARHRGHLSRGQLKVMGAIRACRTAALGGHVARCEGCDHLAVAYNSCRNRHCPKCQGQVARAWLADRQADLLPVPYYHVVFTLPAPIAAVAFQNKAVVYDLLFRTAADTLLTIAADPKHLGARIGLTAVLHSWGSAMTHHPHVHIIVPGGGISLDGTRWVSCRPGLRRGKQGERDASIIVAAFILIVALHRLSPTGAGALPPVPAALPDRSRRCPRGGPAGFLRRDRGPTAPNGLHRLSRAAATEELVRLRQAALRRAGSGARRSRPRHPSPRPLKQPAPRP